MSTYKASTSGRRTGSLDRTALVAALGRTTHLEDRMDKKAKTPKKPKKPKP
jgi:hypothetical protein